jgi:hypothetical protein
MDGLTMIFLAGIAVLGFRVEQQRREIHRLKAAIGELKKPGTGSVEATSR